MKAIITKYLGPTTYRGSRVKATDEDGNSITVSWRCEFDTDANHDRAVIALCEKMGWHGELICSERLRKGVTVGRVYVWERGNPHFTV